MGLAQGNLLPLQGIERGNVFARRGGNHRIQPAGLHLQLTLVEGLQDAVRTDEQFFVFIGVHLGDGRQTGGFVAEVIVQGINRLADALEVSVDGFIKEGHQEAASTAGLLDPFQR